MGVWQVQQAKAHFSELIEQANTDGPQSITRHGVVRAVVVSEEEYRELQALKEAKQQEFHNWFWGGPKFDDFTIERDQDPGREIEL